MYICFYYFWHDLQFAVFEHLGDLQAFLHQYENDDHFSTLCLIQNRSLYYLDPDEFKDYFLKAGEDDDNK